MPTTVYVYPVSSGNVLVPRKAISNNRQIVTAKPKSQERLPETDSCKYLFVRLLAVHTGIRHIQGAVYKYVYLYQSTCVRFCTS